MTVFTERHPAWIDWIAPDRFNDEELFRIVIFFVFHSPCRELSSMGRTLQEYGWNTPWRYPYHLNRQLKQAASTYELLYSAKNYDCMSDALERSNLLNDFPSDWSRERICIYDNQNNQFMSVFYHLRNAFAHCRLNMVDVDGECVLILEDIQNQKGEGRQKVSARMILRKRTLLRWVDLIEGGERPYMQETDC